MRNTFSQSNHHRNPKKTTTFAFNKRSVTYLRKYPIFNTLYLIADIPQKG
ncbi:hypothetical protein [Phocaeicola massiliensis]|nr:hypothetical protein [Phocaeicola massiliensis]